MLGIYVLKMNADRHDELDESGNDYEFVCPLCPQTYKHASTVRLHLLSHGGSVKCRDCQDSVNLSMLKQHLRRNHQVFSNFPDWYQEKIEELQSRFPVLTTQMSSSETVKKFKCEKCNMKFRYSLTLDSHHCCPVNAQTRRSIGNVESSKENNSKLIKCHLCAIKVEPDQLSVHLKNFHSIVMPKCIECESEFNSLNEYKNHVSSGRCPLATKKSREEVETQQMNADTEPHLNSSVSADNDSEVESQEESKAYSQYEYCCPLDCEFTSRHHGLVRRHIIYNHSSIQCSRCDATLKLPFLKRHLKLIHGETKGNVLPKSYYKAKADMEAFYPKITKRLKGSLLGCVKCRESFTSQKLLDDHVCKMLRSSLRTPRPAKVSTPLSSSSSSSDSSDEDEVNESIVSTQRGSVKRKLTNGNPTKVLCKFCPNMFNFRTLKKHFNDSHPNFKMAFTCNICNRNFRKVNAYKNHHRFCVPPNEKTNQEVEVTVSDESMVLEVKEEEVQKDKIENNNDDVGNDAEYTPQLKKSRIIANEKENERTFSEPPMSVERKVDAVENKSGIGNQKPLLPSPKQIFNFLNSFVIGRDECKKALSVAAFNHYLKHTQNSHQLVTKENILLIGPTGSSKSSLVAALATCFEVPFVHIDCQLLQDNEILGPDMLGKLVKIANGNMDQVSKAIVLLDQFDSIGKDLQRSLYKLLTTAKVEYEDSVIETRSILFICSGEFHSLDLANDKSSSLLNQRQVKNAELANFGLIPELVALFPVKIVFQGLTVDSVVNTLQNSLVKEFSSLFQCYNNCVLEITLVCFLPLFSPLTCIPFFLFP